MWCLSVKVKFSVASLAKLSVRLFEKCRGECFSANGLNGIMVNCGSKNFFVEKLRNYRIKGIKCFLCAKTTSSV